MLITEQNWLAFKPEETSQLVDLLATNYRQDTAIFCGPPATDLTFGRERNIFVDCQSLNKVREHVLSDMVLAVETGITMSALAELLAQSGQVFPVDVEASDLRLIDVIAAGDGGYLEQGFGYMRSLVLGLEVAYGDGKCAKLGGRVVKNVTGFDLTKLVVGGRGIFGIPYLAHLRLFAKTPAQAFFVVGKKSAADLLLMATKLLLSGLPLTGLDLVESGAAGGEVSAYQYSLVVNVMGSDAHVTSVSKQLREHAAGAFSQWSREDLIKEYSVLVHPAEICLELALSRASAAALIDHLGAVGQRGLLHYRPGMGRLFYLVCGDEATLEKSFDLVSKFLSGTKLKTGGNYLAEFEQATISKCKSGHTNLARTARGPGIRPLGSWLASCARLLIHSNVLAPE